MADWTTGAERLTKRLKNMSMAEMKRLGRDPEQVATLRALEAEINTLIGDLARVAHAEDEGIPAVWCDSDTYMAHLRAIWAENDRKRAAAQAEAHPAGDAPELGACR